MSHVLSASSSRRRASDARRAALYCGLYVGAVLAMQVFASDAGAPSVALAFVLWGLAGAAAGVAAVYTGAAWRTEAGKWHVAPAFVALAVGTPVALLAGFLPGEPRLRNGLLAAGVWIAGVALVSVVMRLRRRPA